MTSFNTAFAASDNTNNTVKVSSSLVRHTMLPKLMDKKFQENKQKQAMDVLIKNSKAEQQRMDQVAQAQRQAELARQAQIEAAQKAQEQKQQTSQPVSQAPTTSTNATTPSGVNKGTFKLSFYDPAVLGSNMGYGGVAANLSVFPKGTKLKITLPDGTVWIRVVNDTGTFAASNPRQLDVAMPNSQVPAAGILSATVEVIG